MVETGRTFKSMLRVPVLGKLVLPSARDPEQVSASAAHPAHVDPAYAAPLPHAVHHPPAQNQIHMCCVWLWILSTHIRTEGLGEGVTRREHAPLLLCVT